MNNISSRTWLFPTILSSVLFIAAFLFFGFVYPHHIHFHEQYQLFLFDADYITDIISVPGGIADLIGRFLTQFFLYAWLGAAIVAILLVGVFLLMLRIAPKGWLQALGLLPSIILWIFFCDVNALLGAIIAILLALLAEWAISAIGNRGLRQSICIISVPVLYWALGPAAIICCVLYLISAIRAHDKKETIVAAVSTLAMIVMPLFAQNWVPIPLDRLYLSPHYYRYLITTPYLFLIAIASIVIIPILPHTSSCRWKSITAWAIIICTGGFAIKASYSGQSEDVLSYDFMCRFQQWNRLINAANHKKPKNSLSCTALNLALGMKGLLADRMFEYNQNGTAGLLPEFKREQIGPLTTGEVYYHLGMINTAQRFIFEAQEAISDHQKSGRCYKRLAETNLINGNYEVARKYLIALSKSMFYSDWAEEAMPLLYNEKAIAQHKEYGRLRSLMPKEDKMFQDRDIPDMLGLQVLSNGTNQLAYEYMQCAYLLNGDLDAFVSHLDMSSDIKYQRMPYMFQQAYGIWWGRNHKSQDKMPEFISPSTIANMNQFFSAAQQQPVNKDNLRARFGNTYWCYYFIH